MRSQEQIEIRKIIKSKRTYLVIEEEKEIESMLSRLNERMNIRINSNSLTSASNAFAFVATATEPLPPT